MCMYLFPALRCALYPLIRRPWHDDGCFALIFVCSLRSRKEFTPCFPSLTSVFQILRILTANITSVRQKRESLRPIAIQAVR